MASNQDELLSLRHTALGWWCLFGFGLLGLVLESLNGFKVGWYMDLANSTRRHMWTLGHAHGTLLGLVNLAWARGLGGLPRLGVRQRALASVFLGVATTLLGVPFFFWLVRTQTRGPA